MRPRALAILALAFALPECSGSAEERAETSQSGQALYERTCALCHGRGGEGYVADNATALRSPTFLASASDELLRRSIARGRPGTTMSAWSTSRGGPHDDAAIRSIIAYVRSWQSVASVDVDRAVVAGDAARGAPLYAERCASCHGATGVEGPNVRLGNAELLAAATDGFLRYAIAEGRPGTSMKGFATELGEPQIADLVALIRSWAKPVADGEVRVPGTLGPIVLNPGGPEPDFVLGTRYTPADTIKRELDRGASFGFLDARPPSDYVAGHIAGANDVPFYAAGDYLYALPKDKWLVCYCACPHAESGVLADALLSNGFSKVTILDEGYLVWRDRGYPTKTGETP